MSLSASLAAINTPQNTGVIGKEGLQILPASTLAAPGIDIECLDASQLLALSALFPKDRGRTFVALLLHAAVIRHIDSPEIGPVETAVVIVKSIEAFARQHGQSKDTALRYIDILEALQMLRRYRHAEYTELHIPLVAWTPSEQTLVALDALLAESAARAKLQQLASSVKDRFLLLFGAPHSWSSLFDGLHEMLTDLNDLLDKRLSPTKRSLLKLRITKLDARLLAEGDPWTQQQEGWHAARVEKGDFQRDPREQIGPYAAQQGDFSERTERSQALLAGKKGDFQSRVGKDSTPARVEKGDFQRDPREQIGLHAAQQGDFQTTPPVYHIEKGDFQEGSAPHVTQKGDFQGSLSKVSPPVFAQKGDFYTRPGSQNEHNLAEKGDFQEDLPVGSAEKGDFQEQSGRRVAEKGDFQEVAFGASFNVNVITLSHNKSGKDNVNVNDATTGSQDRYSSREAAAVGRQLAMFLEQTPANVGGFVNKCKACTRTTVRAAVIDALVHAYFPTIDPADVRGRPQSRAAWFHTACNDYTKLDASVPAFVLQWLKTDLSWEEIEQALRDAAARYARYMIADGRTADLVRRWLRGELTVQALDEALQNEAVQTRDTPDRVQTDDKPPSRSARSNPHLPGSGREQQTKDWMDEGEAEELAHHILQEAGPLGVTGAVAKQELGRGVYLVELVWDGYRMVMRSPQAWEKHFAGVLRSRELQQQYLRERAERGGNHGTAQ